MLQTRCFLVLLALILLGPSSSEGSVNDGPKILVGHKETEGVTEYSPVNNGSLNRNLVTQDRFKTEKFNAFDRFGNKENQGFLRKFKTLLFDKPVVTSRGKTAQFDPVKKADLRRKRSLVEKAAFTPSYAVFLLELIMVLSGNVFAHMVRTYKNSVPHIKLNIIIVISHYIVELANVFLTFQVWLTLTNLQWIYLTSTTEPCQNCWRYPFFTAVFTNMSCIFMHTAK